MEGDIVTMQDIFTFDMRSQLGLRSTGLRPKFLDTLADHGVAVPMELFGKEG
jgi:pilus assembly protein CpaF